jgi:hypothetical protein
MSRLTEFWSSQPPEIQAALIAAVVSFITAVVTIFLTPLGQYLIGKRQLRHRLKTEYEYEQRKQLTNTINDYRGLILNYADIMKTRIFNLYTHEGDRWLKVKEKDVEQGQKKKDYQGTGYYFRTTVYRFLAITTSIQRFEDEALYIDSKIAEKADFDFVYSLKFLQKAATDVSLFRGTNYDSFESTDHFFSDSLREIANSCWRDGQLLTREQFKALLGKDDDLDPALEFFDDLKAGENRFRWDRLVVFHLLLVAFINTFGYRFQATTEDRLRYIAGKIEHMQIGWNMLGWLKEYEPSFGRGRYGKNLRTISNILNKEMDERARGRR